MADFRDRLFWAQYNNNLLQQPTLQQQAQAINPNAQRANVNVPTTTKTPWLQNTLENAAIGGIANMAMGGDDSIAGKLGAGLIGNLIKAGLDNYLQRGKDKNNFLKWAKNSGQDMSQFNDKTLAELQNTDAYKQYTTPSGMSVQDYSTTGKFSDPDKWKSMF